MKDETIRKVMSHLGSKGGKKNIENNGTERMREIGIKGGRENIAKNGSERMKEIGRLGGLKKAENRKKLENKGLK